MRRPSASCSPSDWPSGAIAASLAGGFDVDLFSYLFGNILTISDEDLLYILLLSMAVLAFCLLFYKELVAMTFDTSGARLAGVPVASFDLIFNVMVAFTVVDLHHRSSGPSWCPRY